METEQKPTLNFNDKEYLIENLSESARIMVANLQDIARKSSDARMQLDQLEAARVHFTQMLEAELEGDGEGA
jgi:DNA invertase Pin-like site-specific DNA recombinase